MITETRIIPLRALREVFELLPDDRRLTDAEQQHWIAAMRHLLALTYGEDPQPPPGGISGASMTLEELTAARERVITWGTDGAAIAATPFGPAVDATPAAPDALVDQLDPELRDAYTAWENRAPGETFDDVAEHLEITSGMFSFRLFKARQELEHLEQTAGDRPTPLRPLAPVTPINAPMPEPVRRALEEDAAFRASELAAEPEPEPEPVNETAPDPLTPHQRRVWDAWQTREPHETSRIVADRLGLKSHRALEVCLTTCRRRMGIPPLTPGPAPARAITDHQQRCVDAWRNRKPGETKQAVAAQLGLTPPNFMKALVRARDKGVDADAQPEPAETVTAPPSTPTAPAKTAGEIRTEIDTLRRRREAQEHLQREQARQARRVAWDDRLDICRAAARASYGMGMAGDQDAAEEITHVVLTPDNIQRQLERRNWSWDDLAIFAGLDRTDTALLQINQWAGMRAMVKVGTVIHLTTIAANQAEEVGA